MCICKSFLQSIFFSSLSDRLSAILFVCLSEKSSDLQFDRRCVRLTVCLSVWLSSFHTSVLLDCFCCFCFSYINLIAQKLDLANEILSGNDFIPKKKVELICRVFSSFASLHRDSSSRQSISAQRWLSNLWSESVTNATYSHERLWINHLLFNLEFSLSILSHGVANAKEAFISP